MEPNIAAWMIAGGPHVETTRTRREREQLHAFRESQRVDADRHSLVDRLRAAIRPAPVTAAEPACCPA